MSGGESLFEFEWTENVGVRIGANLSKREYFAGLAMQGILACPMSAEGLAALKAIEDKYGNEEILRMTANSAIKYADALLAELAKERG